MRWSAVRSACGRPRRQGPEPVLRILVALLLVANLAFFALSRGWLEPWLSLSSDNEHEPQRLAAQVNPQQLRVLSAEAAASAPR